MRYRSDRTLSLTLSTLLMLLSLPARAQLPDEPAIRAAVERRLADLQSVIVEYDVEHSFFPDRAGEGRLRGQPDVVMSIKTGTERSTERFSFLAGRARWDVTVSPETAEAQAARNRDPIVETTRTFVEPEEQQLDVRRKGGPVGSINPRKLPSGLPTFDLALGLRDSFWGGLGGSGGWVTPHSLRNMIFVRDPHGRVIMERRADLPLRWTLRWTLDPKLGYAVRSVQRIDNESGKTVEELTATNFANFEGFMLPQHVVMRDIHDDGHVSRE